MGGFRAKFILLLVVYFAGFATAIYCLAPVPDNYGFEEGEQELFYSALKSDDFAKSFNSGLHKCVDFAKSAALQTSGYLREKYENDKLGRDG